MKLAGVVGRFGDVGERGGRRWTLARDLLGRRQLDVTARAHRGILGEVIERSHLRVFEPRLRAVVVHVDVDAAIVGERDRLDGGADRVRDRHLDDGGLEVELDLDRVAGRAPRRRARGGRRHRLHRWNLHGGLRSRATRDGLRSLRHLRRHRAGGSEIADRDGPLLRLDRAPLGLVAELDHRHGRTVLDDDHRRRVLARRATDEHVLALRRRRGRGLLATLDDGRVQLAHDIGDVLRLHAVAVLEQPLAECVAKLRGALVALVDGLAQRLAHDLRERWIDVRAILVVALQLRVANHEQHVELVRRGKQPPSREQLREHDADAEHVATRIERLLDHLLG